MYEHRPPTEYDKKLSKDPIVKKIKDWYLAQKLGLSIEQKALIDAGVPLSFIAEFSHNFYGVSDTTFIIEGTAMKMFRYGLPVFYEGELDFLINFSLDHNMIKLKVFAEIDQDRKFTIKRIISYSERFENESSFFFNAKPVVEQWKLETKFF